MVDRHVRRLHEISFAASRCWSRDNDGFEFPLSSDNEFNAHRQVQRCSWFRKHIGAADAPVMTGCGQNARSFLKYEHAFFIGSDKLFTLARTQMQAPTRHLRGSTLSPLLKQRQPLALGHTIECV